MCAFNSIHRYKTERAQNENDLNRMRMLSIGCDIVSIINEMIEGWIDRQIDRWKEREKK